MPRGRFRFTRTDNLKGIRSTPVMTRIVRRGFDSLGRTLKSKVRALSPKDKETFIRSIFYTVTGRTLSDLALEVASDDEPKKVAVIEKGRGRGKRRPPPERIRGWVRRKGLKLTKNYRASRRLGPITPTRVESPAQIERRQKRTERLRAKAQAKKERGVKTSKRQREINSLAFMIGRSIGKKGIRGRKPFSLASRQNRDLIRRMIASMNEQIARELNK